MSPSSLSSSCSVVPVVVGAPLVGSGEMESRGLLVEEEVAERSDIVRDEEMMKVDAFGGETKRRKEQRWATTRQGRLS